MGNNGGRHPQEYMIPILRKQNASTINSTNNAMLWNVTNEPSKYFVLFILI